MNLCIDQGNTRTKIAIFDQDNIVEQSFIDEQDFSAWQKLFEKYPIQQSIISSVKTIDENLKTFLQERSMPFIVFSHLTPIPIKNNYSTPETLGKDRLAAIIGAYSLEPNKPILVIDAGTAITFDFVNANGEYLGGTISPGLQMRFKALHSFTNKLPLITEEGENPLLGKTTEEAIRSGVVNGMISEIEGYIQSLREEQPELMTFFTGGDTFFFVDKLKNTIFANQNLVLIGLNRIIKYNA
jgi:type III pantothenate kinase